MAVVKKELTLDSLRVGMVLAQDVIDPKTNEIVAKSSEALDLSTIVKLKTFFSQIEADSDVSQEDADILNGSLPYLMENERQTYVSFKNAYAKSYDTAHAYISAISTGEMPDINKVTKITSDIMRTLRGKSDVFAYINYLKIKDDFLYDHLICVSLLCRVFASWLKLTEADTETLVAAGLLHDVGMTKVPEAIIKKQDKLSDEEFAKIMMHPIYGYNIISEQDISDDIKQTALQHHERIDGTGYPNHLTGAQINRFAKIVAILDVFSAMIYNRPYREKFAPFKVIKTFEREYLDKLDTEFLMVFLQNIAFNYIDRFCMLSNGRIGKIVFINKQQCSAPIVQLSDGEYVDLLFDKTAHIVEIL